MLPHPLRLLVAAYGASLAAALALHLGAGVGPVWVALVAWLLGPVLVWAFPQAPVIGRAFLRPDPQVEDTRAEAAAIRAWIAEEEELRRWEADLAAEAAVREAERQPAAAGAAAREAPSAGA